MAVRIIALGELLIDFTSLDENMPLERVGRFARDAGGAPANVAVAVARLGGRAAFAGCVGDDPFGRYLVSVLGELGVEAGYVSYVREATSLAFVAVHQGEPDYHFVRSPGADNRLTTADIDRLPVDSRTILHFGSNSLAAEPIRSAMLHLLARAEDTGALVSFDVNLRPAFWADLDEAPALCRQVAARAQIVKVNRAELAWLTGAADMETGLGAMREMTGAAVVCTLGGEGALAIPAAFGEAAGIGGAGHASEPGAAAVGRGAGAESGAAAEGREAVRVRGVRATLVNATGAGDAFIGAFLYQLAEAGDAPRVRLMRAGEADYAGWLRFAAAAAACNVELPGAMYAMPDPEAVLARLARR